MKQSEVLNIWGTKSLRLVSAPSSWRWNRPEAALSCILFLSLSLFQVWNHRSHKYFHFSYDCYGCHSGYTDTGEYTYFVFCAWFGCFGSKSYICFIFDSFLFPLGAGIWNCLLPIPPWTVAPMITFGFSVPTRWKSSTDWKTRRRYIWLTFIKAIN